MDRQWADSAVNTNNSLFYLNNPSSNCSSFLLMAQEMSLYVWSTYNVFLLVDLIQVVLWLNLMLHSFTQCLSLLRTVVSVFSVLLCRSVTFWEYVQTTFTGNHLFSIYLYSKTLQGRTARDQFFLIGKFSILYKNQSLAKFYIVNCTGVLFWLYDILLRHNIISV